MIAIDISEVSFFEGQEKIYFEGAPPQFHSRV